MDALKLIAFDAEDLAVISAHFQDAVLKVGDLAYLPGEKRFAVLANRFDWMTAKPGSEEERSSFARRQCALRFERVLRAQVSGLDLMAKSNVLSFLAMQFEPKDAPAGTVTLIFSGHAAIRLEVECIEAELKDLGPAWEARAKPKHASDTEAETQG